MKQILKWSLWILFLVPFVLGIIWLVYDNYKYGDLSTIVKPVEAISWKKGVDNLTIKVTKTTNAEKEEKTYLIEVTRPDGITVLTHRMVVNVDMWGGGFVKAMNVDEDDELELVAWDSRGDRYFLDYTTGVVVVKQWTGASAIAQSLAERFYAAETTGNVRELYYVLAIIFYILSGIIVLIVLAIRTIKRRNIGSVRPR